MSRTHCLLNFCWYVFVHSSFQHSQCKLFSTFVYHTPKVIVVSTMQLQSLVLVQYLIHLVLIYSCGVSFFPAPHFRCLHSVPVCSIFTVAKWWCGPSQNYASIVSAWNSFRLLHKRITRAWQNSDSLVARWPHAASAWERRLSSGMCGQLSFGCNKASWVWRPRCIAVDRSVDPGHQSNRIPLSQLWWSSAQHGRYPNPPWVTAHSSMPQL